MRSLPGPIGYPQPMRRRRVDAGEQNFAVECRKVEGTEPGVIRATYTGQFTRPLCGAIVDPQARVDVCVGAIEQYDLFCHFSLSRDRVDCAMVRVAAGASRFFTLTQSAH